MEDERTFSAGSPDSARELQMSNFPGWRIIVIVCAIEVSDERIDKLIDIDVVEAVNPNCIKLPAQFGLAGELGFVIALRSLLDREPKLDVASSGVRIEVLAIPLDQIGLSPRGRLRFASGFGQPILFDSTR